MMNINIIYDPGIFLEKLTYVVMFMNVLNLKNYTLSNKRASSNMTYSI